MLQALDKPLKFFKNITDMLREKIKQDHIKCSSKTREAGKEWKTKTRKKQQRKVKIEKIKNIFLIFN